MFRRTREKAVAITLWLVAACGQASPSVPDYPTLPARAPARPAANVDSLAERYQSALDRIRADLARSNHAYDLLTELCDTIGPRLSGSPELERALAWAEAELRRAGHEAVAIEPVSVRSWDRGIESLVAEAPFERRLSVLGLGGSVGTPPRGVVGEVVVIRNPEELAAAGDRLEGKIVLFNAAMPPYDRTTGETGYGQVVAIRVGAARMAAEHGAAAALVRSLTARSLGAPHTGAMAYGESGRRIPAAAINVEDAEWIDRLVTRGETVRLRLTMGARERGEVPSGNVVAELRGREHPDEVVVIGGHIDSWDVGQGAHDNGSGVVIAMEALSVLRRLSLVPRRTIRVVLWTNEENGLAGARGYAAAHRDELSRHVAAIESDTGGDRVTGLSFHWPGDAEPNATQDIYGELSGLLGPIGADEVQSGFAGADLGPLVREGVIGIGLRHDLSTYFDVHHSAADTMDKIDPDALAQGVVAMAISAYVLADSDLLPRP